MWSAAQLDKPIRPGALRALAIAFFLGWVCRSAVVYADEPYVTDDARLLEAGACQLETGKRVFRGRREWWVLPACNFTGNLELTLGRTGMSGPDSTGETSNLLQFKGLFKELETNGHGWGWQAGTKVLRHPQAGQRKVSNHYASLLSGHSFFDDKVIAHANLGTRYDRIESRAALTGAIAGEFNVTARTTFIAEAYDDSRSRRAYQTGVRFILLPDHVEINASIGGEPGNFRQSRYWTIGIHLISPRFLP